MENVKRVSRFHPQARLDERTFEAIFYEHYDRIYAVLFRLTGDPDEADDLAAEVFWRLLVRPPALDGNLGGWLYRVATRLGYNHLRASRRRSQHEALAGLENQPAAGDDPAGEAERLDERRRVRVVLRQMPLRDVQILILRHSGLPYREIAAAVGVASASVGTLLARAEKRFEELYAKES